MADGDFPGAESFSSAPSAHDLAGYPFNDLGNAMRLIRYAGGVVTKDSDVEDLLPCQLLFLREHGWIGFNGRYWDLKGGEALARKLAAKVARGMHAQAEILAVQLKANNALPRAINEVYDFAESCGNNGRLNAMLSVAKTYLEVDLDVFDRDPLALNCRNGTLKFARKRRNGALYAELTWNSGHSPGDRITRMADVDYDPDAQAPLFMSCLAIWHPKDIDRKYLQVLAGYSFTGDTSEQIFTVFQGKGRDGKSTYMYLLRKIAGTYGATADVKTFLDMGPRSGADATPDLARLSGDTRLISTAEPPKNSKLSDDRIKSFTGLGQVIARHLKQGIIEFEPIGKVVLECNSRPQPQGTDEGIWRRIKLVLWKNQIAKNAAEAAITGKPASDKNMPRRLDLERSGVLNWVVEGIKRWLVEGVIDPPSVVEALDDYRKGSNALAEWIGDYLVFDPKAETLASALYKSYKAFVEERDEKPMSQTSFGKAMSDLQIVRGGRNAAGQIMRRGARLKTEMERAADAAQSNESGAGGQSGSSGSGLDFPPDDDDATPFDGGAR